MLLELSEVLEKKLGLIRIGFRDGDEVIELAHDYLVESLEDLQQRIKGYPAATVVGKLAQFYRELHSTLPHRRPGQNLTECGCLEF